MTRFPALVLLCASLAAPAVAAPNPQLTHSVADRLAIYGIDVVPEALTTAQAAALHTLLVSERGYITIKRKAENILRSEAFRD